MTEIDNYSINIVNDTSKSASDASGSVIVSSRVTLQIVASLLRLYEKTTCQFQIKLITDNYLQMCKTLQLFTNIFTLNANIFTSTKFVKKHMYRNESYLK